MINTCIKYFYPSEGFVAALSNGTAAVEEYDTTKYDCPSVFDIWYSMFDSCSLFSGTMSPMTNNEERLMCKSLRAASDLPHFTYYHYVGMKNFFIPNIFKGGIPLFVWLDGFYDSGINYQLSIIYLIH